MKSGNGTTVVRPKVLVVDDDGASRRLLAAVLTQAGFDVTTARDGKEALRSIELDPPAIAVLDFEMPRLNGAEVCARIRSDERPSVRDLPIVMLTAHSSDDDEIACLQAGANDFVTKPVSRAVLSARMQTQLRLQALGDALREQNNELARWRAGQMADLEAAGATQTAIIPQSAPAVDGWKVESMYAPLIQVGGDVYGWRRKPNGDWFFWLADATGHGVSAALFTTLTALLFQQGTADSSEPGEVLAQVNNEFCNVFRGRSFMTACCAKVSPDGTLAYSAAGHPPLVIKRKDGSVEQIGSHMTVIGLKKSDAADQSVTRLATGEHALLYTDGLYSLITEGGERMRADSVQEALAEVPDGSEIVPEITKILAKRSDGSAYDDDVAVISLLRTAREAGPETVGTSS